MINLSAEQQKDILAFIRTTVEDNYKPNSTQYRDLMTLVYDSLSTFELPDLWDNLTRFKINKAHEIVRKVVPRVFAKSPKFNVTPRTDAFYEEDNELKGEEYKERQRLNEKMAAAVQDYLTVLFQEQDLQESLKIWATNQVTYWNAYAQIIPKYIVNRNKSENGKVNEKYVSTLPTIDNISWTEMFYDPRYRKIKDMPWIMRIRDGVRLRDLYLAKDEKWNEKYFNLDKLESLSKNKFDDSDSYKNLVYDITWVSGIEADKGIDKNAISLQVFEGYFSLTGKAKDEKMYEITTVDYQVVIGIQEITQISIVDVKCHEDPELFFAVGFVAPIIGLQDEINFKKNSYANAINKALRRKYFWAPESGTDPMQLLKDDDIVVCTDGVQKARENIEEIVNNPLPAQYFSDVNDNNRDIYNLTHTTDVAGQSGQTAQIDTATGARIAFYESNSVIAEVRKNLERAMAELAYKLLQWTVDNLEDNFVIKNIDTGKFLEIHKEALRDAVQRYEVRIEPGSSSYDEEETRINQAIAVKNILIEAKNAGANINLTKAFKNILSNFPWVNVEEIFEEQEQLGILPQGWEARPSEKGMMEEESPENLTNNVALWNITQ